MLNKHQTEMSVLVTPEMTNFHGNMHGGDILKLLDRVAYTCATRYCVNTPSHFQSTKLFLSNRLRSVSLSLS